MYDTDEDPAYLLPSPPFPTWWPRHLAQHGRGLGVFLSPPLHFSCSASPCADPALSSETAFCCWCLAWVLGLARLQSCNFVDTCFLVPWSIFVKVLCVLERNMWRKERKENHVCYAVLGAVFYKCPFDHFFIVIQIYIHFFCFCFFLFFTFQFQICILTVCSINCQERYIYLSQCDCGLACFSM